MLATAGRTMSALFPASAILCGACGQASTASGDARQAPPVLDVVELSAIEARARIEAGTLTSRALTQAYLDRIAAIDDAGPVLGAIIDVNAGALAEADARDAERTSGAPRGPLHGIPVVIKDNIDVAGMVNSAGSLALADHRPKADAFLVARLRAAGAVVLARTNLSEWANIRSTRSTSGWSSRGGQTKNPYVLDRNPCGSSSGTGVAVSASLAAIGVGTETDGSILCPSAVNGIVGLKPTVGLVSRSGIIPISATQDTAGPMARTVADAALLLNGLVGADAADPATQQSAGRVPADYTAFLDANALAGKRFGLLRQAMGYHPDVDAAMMNAVEVMRKAGAEVVDVRLTGYGAWNAPELDMLLYEFKDGLNRYLAASGAPHPSLASIIAFNTANSPRVMPHFGQELFERAQASGPLTDPAYLKARDTARRLAGPEGLLALLDAQRLDALVAPTASPAWPTDYVLGDHFVGAGYGIAAVAGTPSLTVPAGDSRGLPIGVAFMARPFEEARLIGYGFALEQRLKARKPPAFRPTLGAD